MKTQRFSYFADFAARERMREAKPVKLKKVAFSHFFDTLKAPAMRGLWCYIRLYCSNWNSSAFFSMKRLKTALSISSSSTP